MQNPLPSVIFIPLEICFRHCISFTLQDSPLAQCHSNISALWHSWSIYKQAATHKGTVIKTTRQHKSGISGEGSQWVFIYFTPPFFSPHPQFWFIAAIYIITTSEMGSLAQFMNNIMLMKLQGSNYSGFTLHSPPAAVKTLQVVICCML